MSDFEQNIPDDFWRKAFEQAAETPPPRVWDAVERRLDESEGPKIMPLWGTGLASSRPFVWSVGIAAAVALLMVGWWAMRTIPSENPIARHQPSSQAERVVLTPPISNKMPIDPLLKRTNKHPSTPHEHAQETIALNGKSASPSHNRHVPGPAQSVDRPADKSFAQPMPALIAATPKPIGEQRVADAQPIRTVQRSVASARKADIPQNDGVAFVNSTIAPATSADATLPASELPLGAKLSAVAEQTVFFNPMRTSALRLREPGSIQRIVWFRPDEPAMEPTAVQSKRETREVWASVSMMPGAFNPSVTVRPAQTSFAKANTLSNSSASQPSVNSRASFSVAYQAGAGIQLTEHWSVESGVGYLAGRSTVDSPVQASVLNFQSVNTNYSGQNANLYVDALRSNSFSALSATNNSPVANFDYAAVGTRYTVQNSYNPQARQSLTNDYQFVQVPVQVGYQLRPRKRLSLALLGGFLSNIFVRNTVGDDLVVTAKDGVYRPVSWAATMGARFRYRPSRQWSASLAGVYQPSLGSGTRPESTVQSRPTSTGMSFGIDYHF